MNLQLEPTDQKRLEALAKQAGLSLEDLATSILHTGLVTRESRSNGSNDEKLLSKRRKAHEDLLKEMEALPLEGANDGFSGADHDEVLYGWKK